MLEIDHGAAVKRLRNMLGRRAGFLQAVPT
jgi:hypothetical protein